MKKSLVFAMALSLGMTTTANASNPFTDVPNGHWAYSSIDKLVKSGLLTGYPIETFAGDKLMTRYEMAQMVAKAMAKGANVEKLAVEFAEELGCLGVRVNKLETVADDVKIIGQVRYHYADYGGRDNTYDSGLRSRLWLQGEINNDWVYTGMIQNQQTFSNNVGEEDVDFQRAYIQGKFCGLNVTAGRYNMTLVNGNLYDHRADAIEVSYGNHTKLNAFYGKPTDMNSKVDFLVGDKVEFKYGKTYGAYVTSEFGMVKTQAGYTVYEDGKANYIKKDKITTDIPFSDNKVWNIGVVVKPTKDFSLIMDYLKSDFDSVTGENNDRYKIDDTGFVIGMVYRGAKANRPYSWGFYGNWYDQGRGTVMAHTMNGTYGDTGFDGYMIGANYTIAKNIVASVEYYDLKTKGMGVAVAKEDIKTLWSQVVLTF